MSTPIPDLNLLTVDERLDLMERLWESFESRPEELPLTTAQREELDRRIEAMNREGTSGIPWEEVVKRLRDKSK